MVRLRETLHAMKRIAITKGKEYEKITNLNVEINDYNQDINDILVEIGEYVIQNELLKDDVNIQEWLRQIALVRDKIEEKRELILGIKNVGICSRCGAEYPRNSRSCTKCGNEMLKEQR